MDAIIHLLLADDHAVVRQGTAELLQREPDLEVLAQAENGQEAVELCSRLRPDVVVMDIRMPIMSGVEATRLIHREAPEIKVLVLTAHDDLQYVFSLLQAGASGYLLKTAPVSELVRSIRQVYQGSSPLDPAIARKLVLHVSGSSETDHENIPVEKLTSREFEVLQLLAKGLSNRGIAESLVISERTVQAHLTNIFGKMGVASRVEAVLLAIRLGWLTLEP